MNKLIERTRDKFIINCVFACVCMFEKLFNVTYTFTVNTIQLADRHLDQLLLMALPLHIISGVENDHE